MTKTSKNKIFWLAFALLMLAQLSLPAKMIFDRERVLASGTEYRFKTVPIDPSDPFRGKYVRLSYEEDTVEVDGGEVWRRDETIYLSLTVNKEGFATIESFSKQKPSNKENFLKAKVGYVSPREPNILNIDYPFDRFYMEESKAKKAETIYFESRENVQNSTYALISIKDGKAVLKDIMVNGVPIKDLVDAQTEENGIN